jgi:drug/metabolite transporter (DMT)-like permease
MPPSLRATSLGTIWPYLLLTLSQACFSSNHILGRAVTDIVPPIGLSFWRWMGAVIILLPFTWRNILAAWPTIRAQWKELTFISFALVIMGNTMIYVGLNYTTAINASVLAVAQPAVTFILSWIMFRDSITPGQGVGVAIAMVGVLTVLTHGNPLSLADFDLNAGDLFILVAITGLSIYSIMLRRVPKQLSPMAQITLLQLIGAILLSPAYLWESIYVAPLSFTWETLFTILWAAIVIAILAMWLWNLGVAEIGANKASVYVYVRLLFVTVGAILILGETLHIYHFVAFALVFAGIFFVSRARPAASGVKNKVPTKI